MFSVKMTQKDQEIKEFKDQLKEAKATIAELNKQVKHLEKYTPDIEALEEDNVYLMKRNQELLDENMKYLQREDSNRWSISNKTTKRPDTFESDLTDLISGKKKESISDSEELSGEEILSNAIESFQSMVEQYD